jgi:hypothetical protein
MKPTIRKVLRAVTGGARARLSLCAGALAGVVMLNTPAEAQRLQGFADMHTHPMAHLAFGGKILYGAPDSGSLILAGQQRQGVGCNGNQLAGPVASSFNDCAAIHYPWNPINTCGDFIRAAIVEKVEEEYVHQNHWVLPGINTHPNAGHSSYAHWPHWSTVTHQQMRIEWIQRAHAAGLRVLVGLATHNQLLAKAGNAAEAIDDRSSVDLQLREMKRFADRNLLLMQVARTPAELRSIVRSGRIALVLGIETDDFGNFTYNQNFRGVVATADAVAAELRRLHDDLHVRYILPIHFSNTVLGGYAINKDLFALSSREYTNDFPDAINSCGEGIHFKLDPTPFDTAQADQLRGRDLGRIIDHQPAAYASIEGHCGHRNRTGLQPLGVTALEQMMDLGMMIDVDHMSRLAVDEALIIVARPRDYPINSGHNGPSSADCFGPGSHDELDHCSENARTAGQYRNIRALGGMIGLGHGGQATSFVQTYRSVLEAAGNRPLGIGTDANGLYPLPRPDPLAPVPYDPISFPQYIFGRTWDFDIPGVPGDGDGFAHYGMFPDYIRSWRAADPDVHAALRMTDRAMDAFMSSAEGFARMWEKSARRATRPEFTDHDIATGWCTHTGATLLTGDFNGDGSDDLLCRDSGRLWFDYADASGRLQGTDEWYLDTTFCTFEGETLSLADVNGDGRTDLFCRTPTHILIDFATDDGRFGGPFGTFDRYLPSNWCREGGETLSLGDFNGDGRADLLCRGGGLMKIDYASATGYYGATDWSQDSTWCTHAQATLSLADFNGDGRTDLFCRDPHYFMFDYADLDGHFSGQDWAYATYLCAGGTGTLRLGDVNGDGRTDIQCIEPTRFSIDYASVDGRFTATSYHTTDVRRETTWCRAAGDRQYMMDVNGDTRDDVLCRKPSGRLEVDYTALTSLLSR